MDETGKEIAKATQEVAKVAQEGVRATEKLGAFLAPYLRESAEALTGILSDRLQFIRWRQQLRLMERVEQLIQKRGLQGRVEAIPAKLALPIVVNASLEEDEGLQDLWVHLLVAAADPAKRERVHVAFIDVIKQLEPADARLLNYVHERAHEELERSVKSMADVCPAVIEAARSKILVSDRAIHAHQIRKALNLSKEGYQLSVDNLMRQRCLKSYVEEDTLDLTNPMLGTGDSFEFTKDHQYASISVTLFGCHFVETCMGDDAG